MAVNAFTPSASDVGFVINWFPTETISPTASLDDGGIIIDFTPGPDDNLSVDPHNPNADLFPTETIRPMAGGSQLTSETANQEPHMEWKLKEVLISGVIENGDPHNPNVDPSDPSAGASFDDGGFVIDWFPTETIRPTESLDDGGIVIEGSFPTEMIRPTESLGDGGIIIIGGFPTETIRPMESVHHFELLI